MAHDGLYEIPTLQEVINLAKREGVGNLPGDQAPDLPRLRRALARGAADQGAARERPTAATPTCSCSRSRSRTCRNRPRKMKVQYRPAHGSDGQAVRLHGQGRPAHVRRPDDAHRVCAGVARYADGLGPDKNQIVPRDAQNRLLAPTPPVQGRPPRRPAGAPVHVPPREQLPARGLPTRGTRRARNISGRAAISRRSSSCSSSSAWTGCSPTIRTPPSPCGGRSLVASHTTRASTVDERG